MLNAVTSKTALNVPLLSSRLFASKWNVVSRIEMERRLQEKEEEMEALRKNLQFEIDRLIAALADAEARMKSEISRLKKKYQAEIAELEMTVDNL
ncbi:hypothetical protein EXU34_22895, partial [Alteromonas sp. ZYF713]|nr:hypothetical protein [Alteromonas sp. ZYF713]